MYSPSSCRQLVASFQIWNHRFYATAPFLQTGCSIFLNSLHFFQAAYESYWKQCYDSFSLRIFLIFGGIPTIGYAITGYDLIITLYFIDGALIQCAIGWIALYYHSQLNIKLLFCRLSGLSCDQTKLPPFTIMSSMLLIDENIFIIWTPSRQRSVCAR